MASFAAAAGTADWTHSANMAPSMLNTNRAPNWPIVSATYILIPKNPGDADRAAAVLKFYDWAFKSGAADGVTNSNYITLPASVQAQVRKFVGHG